IDSDFADFIDLGRGRFRPAHEPGRRGARRGTKQRRWDFLPEISRERSYEPENWGPQHRMIVALRMAGMKNKEIAERMGLGAPRVSIILNDPRAQAEIQRMAPVVANSTLDAHVRLQLLSSEALDEISAELRESPDEKIRQKAAFGILDRAGYGPQSTRVVKPAPFDSKVEDRLLRALESPEPIDADYEILEAESSSRERSDALPE
ncbi:MAG: hypothetical protein J5I35_03955, partial [Methanothrix harundinacea]|nr:hypothetical protein [Methanothrix harundinacea]